MDAANMLPAMDSDEDPELAELNKPASVRSRDGSHLVGREHPFSPMVNRCAGEGEGGREKGREGAGRGREKEKGTLNPHSPSHCSLLLPFHREMLCNLVRRAFKQTEEQQLQFEQMLKHEYGRRSKGEVSNSSCLCPHHSLLPFSSTISCLPSSSRFWLKNWLGSCRR